MRLVTRDGIKWPRTHGVRPETLFAMLVTDSVLQKRAMELQVTCIVDGGHSRASLHYTGNAFDARIHGWPANSRAQITAEIKQALGPDYDVILEPSHLHVEYQPKTGVNL